MLVVLWMTLVAFWSKHIRAPGEWIGVGAG